MGMAREWVHTTRTSRTPTIFAWQQGPANRGWRRYLTAPFFIAALVLGFEQRESFLTERLSLPLILTNDHGRWSKAMERAERQQRL